MYNCCDSFFFFFFFSSRRRHTRLQGDWSSDVCSSDLFDAGIVGGEAPVYGCDTVVSVEFPGRHLLPHQGDVRDSSIEALAIELAKFDFADIKPTSVLGRVVDFQSAGQSSSLFRREGFVKGSRTVSVQVVHYQAGLRGLRVTFIQHAFDESAPVLAGAVFGDGDVAASGQRFDLQEDFRHSITHILVVDDLTMPRGRRDGGKHFAHQLLVGLVHADERELWIIGGVVNIEHIFHAHDKSGATIGRDFPVFAQVRLKLVFFQARCTLMVETLGAIFSSPALSASKRSVHRARPTGSGEHPKALNRASKAPSKVSSRGWAEGLRSNAASIPSSTNLALRCSMVRVLTPNASATSATFQGLPCSPASHSNNARAWMNLEAAVFPPCVSVSSRRRSSSVRVTLYRGAMPPSFTNRRARSTYDM